MKEVLRVRMHSRGHVELIKRGDAEQAGPPPLLVVNDQDSLALSSSTGAAAQKGAGTAGRNTCLE